ncbi:flagellar protein FliT [Poriferisphaera corsica]|nr:flagellar protein FliT [Poriferisphaera corsica]
MKTVVNAKPAGDIPMVLKLLVRQRDLYKLMGEFSVQQAECVEKGETEELLKVLSQRQYLVDSLMETNAELTPYRERWDSIVANMTEGIKTQVNSLVDEVEGQLREILKRDDVTQKNLQAAKAEVGQQLQQSRHTGAAMGAYRGAAAGAYAANQVAARYMDNRG